MKQHFLLSLFALTLMWTTTSLAAALPGSLGEANGVNGNPHNLSSLSTNTKKAVSETQICVFCHIPHGAMPQTTLWGRPNPIGPNGNYTFPTLTKRPLGIDDPIVAGGVIDSHYGDTTSGYEYPNGASKLCLSCHDGVTAMGVLANNKTIDMVGGNALTISLAISHPISFIYNATVKGHLGATYNFPPLATGVYLDGNSRVQCTSCHQPHQDTNNGTTYTLPFWRGAGVNSATEYNTVCQACHTTTPAFPTIPNSHNY